MSLDNIHEDRMLDLSDQLDNMEVPDFDEQIGDPHFMETLLKNKKEMPSKFQSYWEKDENDIDTWTDTEIENDERKQLLTHAESSYDLVYELLNKNNRSSESLLELLSFQDDDGYTAMHRAAYCNRLDVVKYLLSFEKLKEFSTLKQLEKRTEMGWSPLHSAAYWNSYEVVDYFLKYGHADVNTRTNSGQTALHLCAAKSDCMETILILLTHPSADFSVKNDTGETALEIATRASKFNRLFEITEENLNQI